MVTPEEWAAFELKAAGWKPVYNPPQIGSSCSARLVRCVINSTCLCVGPCCRAAFDMPCCCPTDSFRITKPEAAFGRMLERASTTRRTAYDGVWWMEDNVAGEGLLTLQDAEWFSDSLFFKTAGYNWTVDSCSTGGVWLTFWWDCVTGGRHTFEVSPSGRWIMIVASGDQMKGANWIYVLQEGDVVVGADGAPLPEGSWLSGETLMRVSFATPFDPSSAVTYQYWVQRVARRAEGEAGGVQLTPMYERLKAAVYNQCTCAFSPTDGSSFILAAQANRFGPAPPPPERMAR